MTRRLLVPGGSGAPGPRHVFLCTRGLALTHPHPVKCQLPRSPRLPDAVTLPRPSCYPGDGRGGRRADRGLGSARSQRAPRSLPLGDARSSGSRAATWVVPRAVAHSLKSPELGQWGSGLSRIPGGGGTPLPLPCLATLRSSWKPFSGSLTPFLPHSSRDSPVPTQGT